MEKEIRVKEPNIIAIDIVKKDGFKVPFKSAIASLIEQPAVSVTPAVSPGQEVNIGTPADMLANEFAMPTPEGQVTYPQPVAEFTPQAPQPNFSPPPVTETETFTPPTPLPAEEMFTPPDPNLTVNEPVEEQILDIAPQQPVEQIGNLPINPVENLSEPELEKDPNRELLLHTINLITDSQRQLDTIGENILKIYSNINKEQKIEMSNELPTIDKPLSETLNFETPIQEFTPPVQQPVQQPIQPPNEISPFQVSSGENIFDLPDDTQSLRV